MPMVKIDRSINCPICLEEFAIGEEAKEMPCEHKFHRECIVPWLKTRCSCPLCRFEMPADDLEDSKKSYGVDSDRVEVDDDSGSRESRHSVLWSHVYKNSYWNGSDGGAGDDREEGDDNNDNDSVGGDDGRQGFRSYLPWCFRRLWCRSNESFYPMRRSFSSAPRGASSGKFSLDATEGFSWGMSTSNFSRNALKEVWWASSSLMNITQ